MDLKGMKNIFVLVNVHEQLITKCRIVVLISSAVFTIQSKGRGERIYFLLFVWFVRLLALRPLPAYCASLG
jgi:hypothetical protein